MAIALQALDRNNEAIEFFNKAIELNSTYDKIYANNILINNNIKAISESHPENSGAKKLCDIINKASEYQAIVTDYQESKLQFEESINTLQQSQSFQEVQFQEVQEVAYDYQPYRQMPKLQQTESSSNQEENISQSAKNKIKINMNDLIKIEQSTNAYYAQYDYAWISEKIANECSNLYKQKQQVTHFAKKHHSGIKAIKHIYEISMKCDERLISNQFIVNNKYGKIMVFNNFAKNHKEAASMFHRLSDNMEDVSNHYDIIKPPKVDAMGSVIEQSDYDIM
jgi:tetratricopeptide (TPR) repeat protein